MRLSTFIRCITEVTSKKLASSASVALLFFVITNAAVAQNVDRELDRKAYDLYQQVFSPFCPGRSLNDCPSSKAQELKAEMRQKLQDGIPADAILAEVFQRFGDKFRAVPQYSGFGRLVWWAPLGFLLFGALIVVISINRRRSPIVARGTKVARASQEPNLASDEVHARIRKELESLD